MRKRIGKIEIISIILLGLCIIYAATIISKDAETGDLIIKHNLFSDYTYEIYDDHIKLLFYKETDAKTVTIPDAILGKPVTEIGEYCFSAHTRNRFGVLDRKIETVQMGKNIQIIGERAFSGCELLKEVLGNAEIEEVGTSGFSGCINLQKVEFTVNKIDEDAFGMCDNLEEINFDSKIKYIGEQAFFSCKKLTSIGKQECLEYVGDDAFLVSGLTDFETSEGVEFGDTVLKKTPFLQNQLQYINSGVLMKYTIREDKNYIALPDGINSIDTGCVYGDVSQIQEIYIPDSVTEIKGYILDKDNKNGTYYIPASVTSIGHDYEDGKHIGLNYEAGKIVTTEGSYAQQYAKEHEIPCEIVDHIEIPEE